MAAQDARVVGKLGEAGERHRLVRKQGTSPSASPSDGTVIYSGTQPMVVGSQASGQVYTVFAVYDSRGSGTIEGSSSPERGSFFVP